jgi:hypothetical protein
MRACGRAGERAQVVCLEQGPLSLVSTTTEFIFYAHTYIYTHSTPVV